MAFEQKPDTGALFRNEKRESDSHPNAKGNALIGGVEYWVSAWTNEDRNGNKYQSLKFERKTGVDGRGERKRGYDERDKHPPVDELDDSIPF